MVLRSFKCLVSKTLLKIYFFSKKAQSEQSQKFEMWSILKKLDASNIRLTAESRGTDKLEHARLAMT